MNANKYYSRAIEILMADTVDYKKLAIELAKSNPGIFVTLSLKQPTVVERETVQPWHRSVVSAIVGGNMVNAIKEVRAMTGFGLKEAKDTCDATRTELIRRGKMPRVDGYPWGDRHMDDLHDELRKVAYSLVDACYS